jgi:hypothetical protein
VSGQLHAPAALPPKKRALGTHWIGGWVGPRVILEAVVKRKIPSPRREPNPIIIIIIIVVVVVVVVVVVHCSYSVLEVNYVTDLVCLPECLIPETIEQILTK